MGLISTLKELLGMTEREPRRRRDVEVTVERETDADSERAVKEPVASASTSAEADDDEEAAEIEAAETESTEEEADEAAERPSEDEPEAEAEEPSGSEEPLTSIKGIGDAYAERLQGAGIETVGDLADADPDAVLETADIPRARLEEWIERANE